MVASAPGSRAPPPVRRAEPPIREGGGWRHAGAPRVVDVGVDGRVATVTVALDRRWRARIPMTLEGGRWRLSGFFGSSARPAARAVEAIAGADFPRPVGRPVEVAAGGDDGSLCPELSEADYPEVSGGCRLRVSGPVAPLVVLTAFGDFQFDRCSIAYTVRVDSEGRTWTESFDVEGGPKSVACGDVGACCDHVRDDVAPWRGRLRPAGDDSFLHSTDMCLRTCVGYFIGELTVRLVRDDGGWRAEPVDGGGATGFRFDSPLRVRGDIDIRVATAFAGR